MLGPPLAISLAGLSDGPDRPWRPDLRAAIAWAAGLGYRGITLDGAAAGVRARDLDSSARRDLAAVLRRSGVGFAGIDLWIPSAHFADPARTDRAVSAVCEAAALAADLHRNAALGRAAVVHVQMGEAPADVIAAIGKAADRAGALIADFTWPGAKAAAAGFPWGIGLDPAAVFLAGGDPAKEASRLGREVVAARLSDIGPVGRVPPGAGRLDRMSYEVSLATAGYDGPLTVDLRGVAEQARVAAEAAGG